MKKYLSVFAISVSSLLAGSAFADQRCAPEIPEENRRIVMGVNGQAGIWFPIPIAKCLLSDVEALKLSKQEVFLLTEKASYLSDSKALLSAANVASEAKVKTLEEALAKSDKALEASKPSILESPLLWGAIGVALGAVGTIVLVEAVK